MGDAGGDGLRVRMAGVAAWLLCWEEAEAAIGAAGCWAICVVRQQVRRVMCRSSCCREAVLSCVYGRDLQTASHAAHTRLLDDHLPARC